MNWTEKQEAVARAVAEFPGEFGLRGFPGERFRVSPSASYWSDYENRPLIYTERFVGGEWRDFAKGSAEKLRDELVSLRHEGGKKVSKRRIGPDTIIYVASAWWQDSDPSMGVVATTERRAESKIRALIEDAAREARDDGSFKTIASAMDEIAWSGVHAEKLGTIASGREMEEAIRDLEEDGYWYPPSY
jgi:hypothetical protein